MNVGELRAVDSPMGAPHPAPGDRDVLRELLRSGGAYLRREYAIVGAVGAVLLFFTAYDELRAGINFHPGLPEVRALMMLLGLMLPFVVWRGEGIFTNGPLWALPVERRHHALLKVLAGWFWMLATAVVLLGILVALAWLTGGVIAFGEVQIMKQYAPKAAPQLTLWIAQPWQWLAPVVAATAPYLLASAFVLGVQQPWRWLAGLGVVLVLSSLIGPNDGAVEAILTKLFTGPYAINALFAAKSSMTDGMPTLGAPPLVDWLQVLAVWIVAGLGLLWIAASRHRDR